MDDHSMISLHLGEDRSSYFQAVAPPIVQSSNFAFSDVLSFREAIQSEIDHHIYTRGNNPTVAILRKKLAALEHAEDALVLSSGAAAVSAAMLAFLKAGDHVVCVEKPYSWTSKLLTTHLEKFGCTHTFVDGTSISTLENAITEQTKIIFLESPNSLTFELQDLAAVANLAKARGIITMIDNSHCSPIFQKPLDFGIDLSIHSGTKYLNGHSDVVMGVICGSKAMIQQIFQGPFMTLGQNISPNDAWLAIRGLRTLSLRMREVNESALFIAEELSKHPKIKGVRCPLHASFPQYELAKRQMTGNGGLISIEIDTDSKEKMIQFSDSLDIFLLAVSWGGYESLKMPSVAFFDIPGWPTPKVPFQMVRLYIGLEPKEILLEAIHKALEKI